MSRKENQRTPLSVSLISIILGVAAGMVVALWDIEGKSNGMSTGGAVAIVVALIGVIGSVLVQWYQFKKDSNTIGEVKSDTGEMKPTVNAIDKNVNKITDNVVEKIVPTMDCLNRFSEDSSSALKELVDNLHYQKRLMGETSFSIDRDYFMSGIEKLYEENARLSAETKRLTLENARLRSENHYLRAAAQHLDESVSPDDERAPGF